MSGVYVDKHEPYGWLTVRAKSSALLIPADECYFGKVAYINLSECILRFPLMILSFREGLILSLEITFLIIQ